MGKKNFSEEQIAFPLRQAESGTSVAEVIRNLTPGEIFIEKHPMGRQGAGDSNTPYWATWIAEAWNSPDTYRLIRRYQSRPAEELYDTASDPYEMTFTRRLALKALCGSYSPAGSRGPT